MRLIDRNQHSRLFYIASIGWMLIVPLPGMLLMVLAIALPALKATATLWMACLVFSLVLVVAMIAGRTGRVLCILTMIANLLAALPTAAALAFLVWVLATA